MNPRTFPSLHHLLPLAVLASSSLFSSFSPAAEGSGRIRIEKLDTPAGEVTLPWLGGDRGEPGALGGIGGRGGASLATVRGGWSAENLVLDVEVADADHVPAPDSTRLWAADSLELRLDLAPEDSAVRAEWKLIFGLLAGGPAARTLDGPGRIPPEQLEKAFRVERLERPARTRYRIELPWEWFFARAGARPTLRLGVQVNDLAPGRAEKTVHLWSADAAGRPAEARPTRLVAFGAPAAGFAAVDWARTEVWSSGESNLLSVSARSADAVTVRVGEDSVELPGGEGWRFWTVSVPAQGDGERLVAQMSGALSAEAVQTSAVELRGRIAARVAELTAGEGLHPLFRRHLESVEAMVADDWERITPLRESEPAKVRESLGYYRDLLSGLAADAGEWGAYLDGRRSLLIAYRSEHDGTVQHYMLGLPRDWDEAKRYPLFFELHGAGSNHPLNGPASRLGAKLKAQNLAGYDTPKVYAEIERSGFWVYPFGRGNSGYRGVGRIDVLEAYDDAHRLVKIDANRRYIYGFSMGAGGTYTLAMRTPSRWAAASSFAGGGRADPGSDLPGNLSQVPFKILCGTEDTRAMQGYAAITEEMQRRGIKIEARTIAGLGHQYTGELQKEMIDWLKTHVRRRPERFSFVAEENLTNECWGVRLEVDEAAKTPARAEVRIEGRTVHLQTTGAKGVSLDFSETDGLGLSGDVVVVHNGREAYRGPAKGIRL